MQKLITDALLLVLGTAIVLWGADRFTDSASALARRWKVSEMVIGLTVVAIGTSLPEFVVSFFSAIRGIGDMSIGNILGSNVFNTLVIIGASALMLPMAVARSTVYRDMMLSLGAAIALWALCHNGTLDLWNGLVLLVIFGMFMGYTFYIAKHQRRSALQSENGHKQASTEMPLRRIIVLQLLGLAALVGGGQLMVDSASSLAVACGMSKGMVGLTILAAGTSLPELATSVAAARKGSKGLALGNVLGSNIFNICLVLGVTSLIHPIQADGITVIDWTVLIGSGVLLAVVAWTRHIIGRAEGALLLLAYLTYLAWLILNVL